MSWDAATHGFSGVFRDLSDREEDEFRQWAREHPNEKPSAMWHPVVVDEFQKMHAENMRALTKTYNIPTKTDLLSCKFCWKDNVAVKATRSAPQFDGGDEDCPAVWVPVCDSHFNNWYEDIEPGMILPAFVL